MARGQKTKLKKNADSGETLENGISGVEEL